METTRNAGSCCGHHGATSAPAHRTAAPAPQGYTPVDQLHNEIDRLFGDFFGGFFSPWRAFSGMAPRSADNAPDMLIPHMDLSVTDTAYKATVELPGVAQDQVNIEVRDNMLIVEGEKKTKPKTRTKRRAITGWSAHTARSAACSPCPRTSKPTRSQRPTRMAC